jgi:hypothetical protein
MIYQLHLFIIGPHTWSYNYLSSQQTDEHIVNLHTDQWSMVLTSIKKIRRGNFCYGVMWVDDDSFLLQLDSNYARLFISVPADNDTNNGSFLYGVWIDFSDWKVYDSLQVIDWSDKMWEMQSYRLPANSLRFGVILWLPSATTRLQYENLPTRGLAGMQNLAEGREEAASQSW